VRDALLVSPASARWPEAVRRFLRTAATHVVKLADLGTIGVLLPHEHHDAPSTDAVPIGGHHRFGAGVDDVLGAR